MSRSSFEVLCRYFYDPLDRLVGAGPSQRFYQQEHLVTELDDRAQRSILRHGAQPLAQQNVAGETRLLATDHAHSPLLALSETLLQQISYTSYGHAPAESGLSRLLGFNGQCPERVTGHYLLGQGNRAFNPTLMRFNSPDELSPFEDGGINPYAYCEGDPVNFSDPTGNIKAIKVIKGLIDRAGEFAALPKPNTPPFIPLFFVSNTPTSSISVGVSKGASTGAIFNLAPPFPSTSRVQRAPRIGAEVSGRIRRNKSRANAQKLQRIKAKEFKKLPKDQKQLYRNPTDDQIIRKAELKEEIKKLEGKSKHRSDVDERKLHNSKTSLIHMKTRIDSAAFDKLPADLKTSIRQ